MKSLNIKLYSNTDDNMHCFQACLKMVLSHFDVTTHDTMKELDELTGHIEGKYTWQSRTLIRLFENNFDVIQVEPLDYRRFAMEGEEYLKEIMSPEYFEDQKSNSDLQYEIQEAKNLIRIPIDLIVGTPTVTYLEDRLDDYIFINDPGKPAARRIIDKRVFGIALYSATFVRKRTKD